MRNERRGVFSQAPCISQAPFHVPIRGGYQGGARLSKMDCSDTTQSLQVSLEGQFKKSFLGLSPSIQEVGKLFLVSPQNTSSWSSSISDVDDKDRVKKRSSSGVVFIFVDESGGLRPPHPPLSTKKCESDFCQLTFAHARSTKAGLCKTAPAKHTSTFL